MVNVAGMPSPALFGRRRTCPRFIAQERMGREEGLLRFRDRWRPGRIAERGDDLLQRHELAAGAVVDAGSGQYCRGWRAVVEARAQRRMTPRALKRFAALEKELQESYALSGD